MRKDSTRGENIAALSREIAFQKRLKENTERRAARNALKATNEIKSTEKGVRNKAKPSLAEENKSKQLCLLISPDMHEMIKVRALCEGITVNEYIRRLIEDDLKGEQ